MPKPVYGLKVKPRQYQCHCCGHVQLVSTNHTDNCYDQCMNCYWRSAFKKDEYHFYPHQPRPFKFVGEAPTKEADWNPHCGFTWEQLTKEAA